MRTVTFPYSLYRGNIGPIIPLQARGEDGEWKTIWAYVDSGAFFSIFSNDEAALLGITDPTKGTHTHVVVGDGGKIPVYVFQVSTRIGEVELSAHIGFSPHLGVGFNLLGRQDIFSRFRVCFDDTAKEITFTEK